MKALSLACSAVYLILALGAFAADESPTKVLPPQPRSVMPLPLQALPPRATDPSWVTYRSGLDLYQRRRFGEALIAFRQAIETRAALFDGASGDIQAALATKEAARAKGSLSGLVELLAARDLIPQDLEKIEAKAGGSIVTEMGLLRERSPSDPLRGLIDASLLIVEERGLSRIGDSLDELRKAAADLRYYPEAEFAIAKVYLDEGESELARLQIQRACDMSDSLEVGADRFEMLGALAAVYRDQGDMKDYELTLREISDASDLFSNRDEHYRNAMERTLATQGVDKFMALYRIEDAFARPAYSELGSLYLEAGRPLAVIYLAAAVNAILTREIAEIKVDEPSYSYKGLSDLLARIRANKGMGRFAADSGLWPTMVILGEALSMTGARDSARELWSAVAASFGPADPWGRRAAGDIVKSRNASRQP